MGRIEDRNFLFQGQEESVVGPGTNQSSTDGTVEPELEHLIVRRNRVVNGKILFSMPRRLASRIDDIRDLRSREKREGLR